MAPGIADTLLKLLRSRSDVVPVSRLKKRGLRQVTVLDFRQLQRLVAEAVDRALAERLPGVDPEALSEVRDEAREAVLGLVRERDRLHDLAARLEREKRTLERYVGELRRRLEGERERLERLRAGSPTFEPLSADDLERLERGVLAEIEPVDAAAARRVRTLFEQERGRARRRGEREDRREIERLERRIAKLSRSLERSEALVARLRAEAERPEGIPSEFREVQGLDPEDPNAPSKRGLLEEVFRWNLELRDWMQEEPAGAEKNRRGGGREAAHGE